MGITNYLTCLLRNVYAGHEATVRTRHGTMDWFQIGKGIHQGCILSPCLFNLYAECIMWNAILDEVQAGIKIAGRNINNLRYAYDTTLTAENSEGLKRLFISLLSAVRVVLPAYLRLLIFFPGILIATCASLALHMMYSVCKLNKQGDNIQPWCTPFPIWNQSAVPCQVLIVASWLVHRLLRRQVVWSGFPISWRIFHSLCWSTQSKTLA